MDQLTTAAPEAAAPTLPEGGWGWREVAWTVALTAVAALALSLVARALVAALGLTVEQSFVSPVFYIVGVGIYLSTVAGVYLFAARRAGWGRLGVRGAGWGSFALVPPLFIVEILGLAAVNSLVGFFAGGFENPQVDTITGGRAVSPTELLLLLLLVAGLVPVVEELFFRGMVYPLMRRHMGAAAAIALNAAFFAAAHFIPLLMPGLFVVGLCLAYLRERSGSIWPSVCLHALQNSLAIISINAALASGAL